MRSSQFKTWFLLGYLVLLLNFGPSLHHAQIFGLHSHSHRNGSDDTASGSSCCCHHHSGETLIASLSVNDTGDHDPSVASLRSVKSGVHDCAFCKFFDEYNVVVDSFELQHVEQPIFLLASLRPSAAAAEFVPTIARGPPAS
ncbi:hypothetical protein [Mariniblastus fucicola]|uniref:DUF2946 domain-containing protein n=1 Tax=Mariniblastus fucicola TaxID=980251 RepID=A0A5B9PH58_9BACT|nr:hypothetical protein [Mariniblastus fucicola]QEG23946.1 hypothetical protein MFFC18_38510 [Mariniblastus fucicola]